MTGKWPGKTNGRAIEMCSFIAQAAGIRTADQDKLGGWERHLKAAGRLKNRSQSVPDNVLSARLEVVAAWQQAGVWGDAIAPVAAD